MVSNLQFPCFYHCPSLLHVLMIWILVGMRAITDPFHIDLPRNSQGALSRGQGHCKQSGSIWWQTNRILQFLGSNIIKQP